MSVSIWSVEDRFVSINVFCMHTKYIFIVFINWRPTWGSNELSKDLKCIHAKRGGNGRMLT